LPPGSITTTGHDLESLAELVEQVEQVESVPGTAATEGYYVVTPGEFQLWADSSG
jgi:hypothetical protein